MTFSDLKFEQTKAGLGNIQARHDFQNGYGVSVVKGPFTYGGKDGLYELAVMHKGRLCYTTPITDDVIGSLTEIEVSELLARVEALTP